MWEKKKKKKTLKKLYDVHQAFHFSKHTPGQGGREIPLENANLQYTTKQKQNLSPKLYLT